VAVARGGLHYRAERNELGWRGGTQQAWGGQEHTLNLNKIRVTATDQLRALEIPTVQELPGVQGPLSPNKTESDQRTVPSLRGAMGDLPGSPGEISLVNQRWEG